MLTSTQELKIYGPTSQYLTLPAQPNYAFMKFSAGYPRTKFNISNISYTLSPPRTQTLANGSTAICVNYRTSTTLYNTDASVATTITAPVANNNNLITVVYDNDGMMDWVVKILAPNTAPNSLIIVPSKDLDVYVSAAYPASADSIVAYSSNGSTYTTLFSGSTGSNTRAFIMRYGVTGMGQSHVIFTGALDDTISAMAIDDINQALYCVGRTNNSTLTFRDFNGNNVSSPFAISGQSDTIIIKLNKRGFNNTQWVARIKSASSDGAESVCVDSTGNVHTSSIFQSGTITIYNADGTTGTSFVSPNSINNYLLTKHSSSGVFLWAVYIISNTGNLVYNVTVSMCNNSLCACFTVSKEITIKSPVTTTTTENTNLTFSTKTCVVARFNSSGGLLWYSTISNSSIDLDIHALNTPASETLYLTFQYVGVVTITNASLSTFTIGSAGSSGTCLLNYSADGTASVVGRTDII